jgi:hypothetical protein
VRRGLGVWIKSKATVDVASEGGTLEVLLHCFFFFVTAFGVFGL